MSIFRSVGKAALFAAGLGTGASAKSAALQFAAQAASRVIQRRLEKRGYSLPEISPVSRVGSPARQSPTTRRLRETKEDVSVTFNGVDENGERVSRVIAEWEGIPHDRAILFSKTVAALMSQLTDRLNKGDY